MYQGLQQAREKLAQIAAHAFGCQPEDVDFQSGHVSPKGDPSRGMAFGDIAARAYQEETLPPGVEPGLEFIGVFSLPDYVFPFGAQIAVVEVDQDTGEVRLVRCFGLHDCGRIINPALVNGQVHGGMAQGIGQAMCEGVIYTPDGQPVTATLMDYAMPIAEDMPELVLATQETVSPTNPLGVKGVGSLFTVGPPSAVSNAVADALAPLGVRHVDTPFTPERVWQAIQDAAEA